jgi:hypothetical protein
MDISKIWNHSIFFACNNEIIYYVCHMAIYTVYTIYTTQRTTHIHYCMLLYILYSCKTVAASSLLLGAT